MGTFITLFAKPDKGREGGKGRERNGREGERMGTFISLFKASRFQKPKFGMLLTHSEW